MTSFKNFTIKRIVRYTAILVWLIQLGTVITLIFLYDLDITLLEFLLLALVTFLVFYYAVTYILEQFIFRKIKLIYKFISGTKAKPNQKSAIKESLDTLSIDEVNEDVVSWADNRDKEIQDMRALESYRKQFVGNISHELKTPLFSIQGYLHTLLDGAVHDDEINIDYLKRAARNTERLQLIVNDLEMIIKLEDDTFVLKRTNFSVVDLTKEIFADLKKMAASREIQLSFKEGASEVGMINADRESIRQVISNLIVNAIKYGKLGGKVVVSFYEVENKVLIEVSDDGIGIEEQHIKRLFDRFYRVNSSRSRREGGSGLGLSIVKHVLDVHGEKIFVRSTPEVGTTFGFTLLKA